MRNPGVSLFAVLLSPLAAFAASPPLMTDTQRILLRAKPAIVRVLSGYEGTLVWRGGRHEVEASWTGTGFFAGARGYVVTNAHVVEATKGGDELGQHLLADALAEEILEAEGRSNDDDAVERLSERIGRTVKIEGFTRVNQVVLQSGRKLPFEIASYGAPAFEDDDLKIGTDVAVLKVALRDAPTLELGDSDLVQVGDRIQVIGYPGAAELPVVDENESLEPTANDGTISARKRSVDGTPLLQTNAAVATGNSGGPVLDAAGRVIGLMTLTSPETQGFNFMIPSNVAAAFVRQAGAVNEVSPTTRRWEDALRLVAEGRDAEALGTLAEVRALHPDHTEAVRLARTVQERLLTAKPARSALARNGVVLAVALALVGSAWAAAGARRRKRARAVVPLDSAAEPEVGPSSARLVCIAGREEGRSFEVGAGVVIGSGANGVDVRLADSHISERHASVGMVGGRMTLTDLRSATGTFLNGDFSRRIGEIELLSGDTISLGPSGSATLRYEA